VEANLIDRSDLIALSERAAKITGISLLEEEDHVLGYLL
jgi:hypothetical protein